MNAVKQITELGQSIWLDNLSRTLIHDKELERLVGDDGISGVTSNPSIFHAAIATSPYYADDLARLKDAETNPERRYEALVVADVQAACDLLRPIFDRTQGKDGYVSLEVSPRWAYDADATVKEGQRLAAWVGRANLLVKVPGTPAGVTAFETLTRLGINVNVTLLFSLTQTECVWQAYLRGLKARMADGFEISHSKAVASLFLSRVDTLVDARLTEIGSQGALALRGKAAVAMAKSAYMRYAEIFNAADFCALRQAGAQPQYLLWASTGSKNPAYSDLIYVEPLIGAETINTMPDKTISAIRDHGRAATNLGLGLVEAQTQLAELDTLGIDMDAVGETLQADGAKLFSASFDQLLALVA
jgi:transaldolase